MKLKCVDHNRRVMVLDNSKVLHRNDGSECSNHVTIGNFRGALTISNIKRPNRRLLDWINDAGDVERTDFKGFQS